MDKIIKNKNFSQNEVRESNEEKMLRKYSYMSEEDLFHGLSSDKLGLTDERVEEKLEKYGKNLITMKKHRGIFSMIKEAFINPFNIVLAVIAIVTFFTDVILSDRPNYLTTSIIIILILVSGIIALVQNIRSKSASDKLLRMITNTASVMRDGKVVEIPITDIYPGDVIRLSSGDMIPADIRFLSTKDTFVAQGVLTGESNPVEKLAVSSENVDISLTDMTNLGFMGSNIISGAATGIVLYTGNRTYFGSMAKTLNENRAKTSFERGVDSISGLLLHMMFVMVPIVFIINGITKKEWLEALLFAVTISVGLTPEMLPVIMMSTLAKGAVAMSKRDVIVKNLGSIQAFGEMDILCTDKTGTLTEDKVVLEKYLNLEGNDDKKVLEYAYLNSYFQTGLKNLIDIAIINRGKENDLDSILSSCKRVDEIPFDFSRRRMSVVLENTEDNESKRMLITKGAVEEILSICTYVEVNGNIVKIDKEVSDNVFDIYRKYSVDGLRMIGIARKDEVPDETEFSVDDEKNMILVGFVGFLDPPKESAGIAIESLKNHGVRTIVLTGDSQGVAVKVCTKVGINTDKNITGLEVEKLTDEQLKESLINCNLFSKLSPNQKKRVVSLLQEIGHTVGYMGDGINDAPSLHQADIGISVDTAVDIAKETADIILLKKDLLVLKEGVVEGRRTFINILKYIKMAASGNFGNMISVIVASIFLPFLPMLPVQILTQNLLCDFSQMGIPFDKVDEDALLTPRKWDTKSIKRFIIFLGPLSSVFDILTFGILFWIMGYNTIDKAPLFQCGWFIFGSLSQIIIIHIIRTSKIPFVESLPSKPLILSTFIVGILVIFIGFSEVSRGFEMQPMEWSYGPWLGLLLIGYCIVSQIMKKVYIKSFGDWIN